MSGRTGQYGKWLTDENLSLIEQWSAEGFSDAQISGNIGIRPETFCRWKTRFPLLSQAVKKGRKLLEQRVSDSLVERQRLSERSSLKNKK